jgi:hypothetical protein
MTRADHRPRYLFSYDMSIYYYIINLISVRRRCADDEIPIDESRPPLDHDHADFKIIMIFFLAIICSDVDDTPPDRVYTQ